MAKPSSKSKQSSVAAPGGKPEAIDLEHLEFDPENALVQAQLAGIHFEAGRYDEAIEAATESLSLLYFQPGVY